MATDLVARYERLVKEEASLNKQLIEKSTLLKAARERLTSHLTLLQDGHKVADLDAARTLLTQREQDLSSRLRDIEAQITDLGVASMLTR